MKKVGKLISLEEGKKKKDGVKGRTVSSQTPFRLGEMSDKESGEGGDRQDKGSEKKAGLHELMWAWPTPNKGKGQKKAACHGGVRKKKGCQKRGRGTGG